ncbi:pectinesterase family protein [Clostridium felsineum]|uniref:pectinesterase family protein n=1 Tax=Clostridium felsineum TaxID=36839 RepID=UPI00098CB189|nr:pectinesterase family protein [Clostridium felsineum]URZ02183.1 hypothetical protein CLAUR_021800 [Clostridium felsineum]
MGAKFNRRIIKTLTLCGCIGLVINCIGISQMGKTVKAATNLTVDINNNKPNGVSTFKNITSAINYLNIHKPTSESTRAVINIKAGTYKEKIDLKVPYVTFNGDSKGITKLTFNASNKTVNPQDPNKGTYGSGNCAALIVEGKDFKANNMTFENSYLKDNGIDTQAACVQVQGDRATFQNCKFYSGQDVLNLNYNRSYFKNCYIEGAVDSVWGLRSIAVFENCTLNEIKDGAAYTAFGDKGCKVLLDKCKFTSNINKQVVQAITKVGGDSRRYSKVTGVLFGRTWYPSLEVCIKNSVVTSPLLPKAWTNMKSDAIDPSCQLLEYKNIDGNGKLLNTSHRNASRQLSDKEAVDYNAYNLLKGTDGWKPANN